MSRGQGTAFVVGDAGLTTALHEAGCTLSDIEPDYVVRGETRTYSFERTHGLARASLPVSSSITHRWRSTRCSNACSVIGSRPNRVGPDH